MFQKWRLTKFVQSAMMKQHLMKPIICTTAPSVVLDAKHFSAELIKTNEFHSINVNEVTDKTVDSRPLCVVL